MYVDDNARGGILEPPGICDVKFRKPDLVASMHRMDSKLQALDNELAAVEESLDEPQAAELRNQIAVRETQLMPLYTQISHEFADLHDRPGRMIAKGVIRDVVPWERAREYFYWRVRRRLAQDGLVAQLKAADGDLTHGACLNVVRGWVEEKAAAWEDDKAALAVFETDAEKIQAAIDGTKEKATAKLITQMLQSLSPEAKSSILGEVM